MSDLKSDEIVDASNIDSDNKDDTVEAKEVENTAKGNSKPDNQNENKQNDSTDQIESKNALDTGQSQDYDPQNIHYDGDTAIYTDPTTGTQYEWDKVKNEWVAKNIVYGFEDDTHVYTDSEGVKYFWDKEKNAWFPKVDKDFMAHYQMNYGFVDNTKVETKKPVDVPQPVKPKEKKQRGEKRKASEPTWFNVDESKNTSVYVSNLPTDIDEEQFLELMQKCGLVARDQQTAQFKIKLYKEPGTNFVKGDGLCTYIKVESVELALNLLDGSYCKDKKIKVERAKFELKGSFDPNLKPKMKKKKEKLKLKRQQEKLFDWRPEKKLGEKAKHERVVIVKNLFDPNIFDTDVGLILEFQQDLREECSKYGEVKKITIYDRHPEGVAQINMGSPEEADMVVSVLNGRWFMKRQLVAEIWDGKTKFKIAETDSEISQRLDNWDKFLEGEDQEKKVEAASENNKNVKTSSETIVSDSLK